MDAQVIRVLMVIRFHICYTYFCDGNMAQITTDQL